VSTVSQIRRPRHSQGITASIAGVIRSEIGLRAGLIAFLAAEIVVFALVSEEFLSPGNVLNAGRAVAILAIVSVGATFGLISGALDISIGSVIALGATVGTQLVVAGQPALVSIVAAILVGGAAGTVNGVNVAKLRVNPIIATLAMLGIARGVAFVIDGGTGVVKADVSLNPDFNIMQRDLAGIPLPLLLAVAAVVLGQVVLGRTKFGRYAYAVGANPDASRAVAIPVDGLRIAYLTLSGFLAGLAGWVFASMVGGVGSNVAQGYELTAITAVIVGGVGFAGGTGSMVGTVLGVLILGVMVNGMTLAGIPIFYQLMGQGFVLLLAVTLDAVRSGGYR
jgi:ribose transport system permease protein